MNSLERTLILKAGYDHGWEVVVEENPEVVVLASSLHSCRIKIEARSPEMRWWVSFAPRLLHLELKRQSRNLVLTDEFFGEETEQDLSLLMAKAAAIARALPNAPELKFEQLVEVELKNAESLGTTEVEATIRRRVGQGIYRDSLMEYWGGSCAVTGVTMPELLRASHAKPWAECESDAERLNVFNGFLLVAHLDALFDRFLLSFDDHGCALISNKIDEKTREILLLNQPLQLRWLADEHREFLLWHRDHLIE
ncbi:HNH endonuclease [Actomonas aquatica]|uniref:HNH endonuclease n=1 Tax=Actomonas aquatica TaxID=2866162 RepID=A0ABZ1CCN8_9BACT|nr:HNH endonuclease [Opitutus sp. WL0086]WRQ88065.1 HNH endonuclease [Opitutus sp. WL0086]